MRSVIRPIRRVLYILIVLGVSLGAVVGSRSFDTGGQMKVFAEDPSGAVFSPSDPALVRQAEDFFIAGAEAEQQGNNAEAEKAYLHCSQFAQEHKLQEFIVPAYHRLAVLKAKSQEYDQSETYFKQVIPDCGENVSLLSDYAKLYINQHRYGEAETILKNIILFAPNDQQVLYNLGYVVAVQPDRQIEGLRYMKLALGEKEAYREIAKIYRTHGHESQATFAEQRARMNSSNRSTSAHASPEDFTELQDHIRKELMRKEVMEIAEEWERGNAKLASKENTTEQKTVSNPIPDPFVVAGSEPMITLPTPIPIQSPNPSESAKIVKTLPSGSPVSKNIASREIGGGQIKTLPRPAETFPTTTGLPDNGQITQILPNQISAQYSTLVPAPVSVSPPAPVSTPVPTLVSASPPAPVSTPVPTPVPTLVSASPSAPVSTPVPTLVSASPPAPVSTPVPTLVSASPSAPVSTLVSVNPPAPVPQSFAQPPSTNTLRQDVSAPQQNGSLVSVKSLQKTAGPAAPFKLEFVHHTESVSAPQQPKSDDKPILAFRPQSTQAAMERDNSQAMGMELDSSLAPVDTEQRLITPEENRPSFALRTPDSGLRFAVAMRPRMPAPSPDTTVRSSPVSNPAPAPVVLALQKKSEQRPSFVADEEKNAGHLAVSVENTNEHLDKKAPVPESVFKQKLEFVHTQPKVQDMQPIRREGIAARTIAKAPSPEITLNTAPVPVQSPVPLPIDQELIVPDVVRDTSQVVVSDTALSQPRQAVAWSRPVVESLPVLPQESEIVAVGPNIPDPGIVCFELSDQPSLVWSLPTPDRQQEMQIASLPPLQLQAPIPVFVPVTEEKADDVQPTQSAKHILQPSLVDDTEVLLQETEAKIPSTLFDSRTDMSRLLETLNVTSKVAEVEADFTESGAGFATTSKGSVNSNAWEVLLQELVKADKTTATTSSPEKVAAAPTMPIMQAEEKITVEEKKAVTVRTIEADEMEEVGFARSGQYLK